MCDFFLYGSVQTYIIDIFTMNQDSSFPYKLKCSMHVESTPFSLFSINWWEKINNKKPSFKYQQQ